MHHTCYNTVFKMIGPKETYLLFKNRSIIHSQFIDEEWGHEHNTYYVKLKDLIPYFRIVKELDNTESKVKIALLIERARRHASHCEHILKITGKTISIVDPAGVEHILTT